MSDGIEVVVAVESTDQVLYRFFNTDGVLLYVGITGDAATRWSNHRRDKEWWPLVRRIEIEPYASRPEVEAAERIAIAAERPLFNKTHNASGRSSQSRVVAGVPTDPEHFTDACNDCVMRRRAGGAHAPHRMEWHPDGDGLDAWYRCPEGHEWFGSWGGRWFIYEDCLCGWCRAKGGTPVTAVAADASRDVQHAKPRLACAPRAVLAP